MTLPNLEVFARAAEALDPYLHALVVIGGWAHRLYREHPRAEAQDFEPLFTEDADLATPPDLQPGAETMRQRLSAAGFREEFLGDDVPPVTRFRLGEERSTFYLEFLTWQTGSGRKRDGTTDDRTSVAGVTAQKLRYLDILMIDPWSVDLRGGVARPAAQSISVQVANPVVFLLQKLLVLERRTSPDKDVLYVFDTLQLFESEIGTLAGLWDRIRGRIPQPAVDKFEDRRRRLFTTMTDPVAGASRIAASSGRPSPPSPERIRELCAFGLETIFGRSGR